MSSSSNNNTAPKTSSTAGSIQPSVTISNNNSNSNNSNSNSGNKLDMSTKIGGRLFQPALPVVDASEPTAVELKFNDKLMTYIEQNIPLESTEGIQTRERVLNRMGTLCRDWIKTVCRKRGLPEDVVESAGGNLFTSGSYRLGVHEPGADIDTILVAPNMCRREDFFGEIIHHNNDDDNNNNNNNGDHQDPEHNQQSQTRDPTSLAERIRTHPDVTNFVPVEGAAVPILTFDWEGINIDLLFARLNSNSVPEDFDIDNDTVLDGVDSATEKSLNGPRVTNLIAALVSGTPERYQTFLIVVRCVRKWAKARGLYSNKMGYWGGVNINIAVALCVQLYPNATPANLLRRFFLVFVTWRWPNPVMLTKPHDAGYGLPVWNAQSVQNARQVAPIITPAYPAMNSTLSVSRQTLQIMHEEFCRGHEIVHKLWKRHELQFTTTNKDNNNNDNDNNNDKDETLNWDELFEPSEFFISYPHYLTLCIVGPTQAEAQAWTGFVESRLRKLVSDMLGRSLPISKIQLWPKKCEVCIADKGALLTQAQRKNSSTYFIGFQIDTLRMRGKQLNIELQLHNFREWELSRFQPLVTGMDVLAKIFKVKELPQLCFVNLGGKGTAMKRRRQLRNADPKRQEKKRLLRLQQLKAKMAEIQQRKKLQQQEEEEQKQQQQQQQQKEQETKEGEDENDTPMMKTEKEENDSETNPKKEEDEANKKRKRTKDNDDDDNNDDDNNEEEEEEDKKKVAVVKEQDEQNDEANLLQNTLDKIQQDTTVSGQQRMKTREEAEMDKRKLLAGELLEDEDYDSSDDDEDVVGYTGVDGVTVGKHTIQKKKMIQKNKKNTNKSKDANTEEDNDGRENGDGDEENANDNSVNEEDAEKKVKRPRKKMVLSNMRSLPIQEEEAILLEKLGCAIVSDDEIQPIGGNAILPPWKLNMGNNRRNESNQTETKEASNPNNKKRRIIRSIKKIEFIKKFDDLIELDTNGHVIDKGDNDFTPSTKFTGRKAGFEFKLGERGLGYYRTGKKVVIPSNNAY